jgi:hypothetical protein
MKKKVIAFALATVLCLSTSLTTLASSTSNSNSGNQYSQLNEAQRAQTITNNEKRVAVGVQQADGTVLYQTYKEYSQSVIDTTVNAANSILSNTMSGAVGDDSTSVTDTDLESKVETAFTGFKNSISSSTTEQFDNTVKQMLRDKENNPSDNSIHYNDMGNLDTVSYTTKTDEDGSVSYCASAGEITGCEYKTDADGNIFQQPIVLIGYNETTGQIETVMGWVDPINKQVVGNFSFAPTSIQVYVLY